jgi:hypothetical protein
MRTSARFAMNRNYAARAGVVIAIGMATLCAILPKARAQGITAVPGGSFRNVFFIAQSSPFRVEFDAIPTGTDNADVGVSDDPTGSFSETSTLVRFHPNGKIDARNGVGSSATATAPYVSGPSYHFREDVDVYSIAVKVPGEVPFKIVGTNLTFRPTANAVFNEDNLVTSSTWRPRFSRLWSSAKLPTASPRQLKNSEKG